MGYQIEAKPASLKDGMKYKIIELTDIKLHTSPKKPTNSVGEKVRNAFRFGKPGRIYTSLQKSTETKDHDSMIMSVIQNDPKLQAYLKEEESKGYKVLIKFPKVGIPIFAGEDTIEFLQSKNGGRWLRGFQKDK